MKYVNTDYVLKYATQKVILDLIIISNLICNNNEIFDIQYVDIWYNYDMM